MGRYFNLKYTTCYNTVKTKFYKNTKDFGNSLNFENVVFYSEYFFYIILKPFNQFSIAEQVII